MVKRPRAAYADAMRKLASAVRFVGGSFVVYIVVACTSHVVNAPKGDQTPMRSTVVTRK
jgi:hypothetical protein